MKNFFAGKISNCYNKWKEITNDPFILQLVRKGLKIDFFEWPPEYHTSNFSLRSFEKVVIDKEITKLLDKKVISECSYEPNEFVSSVFTRPKKDGTHRMILNLKQLNEYVSYMHFKMESLKHVIDIIQPQAWMASVDLKDAMLMLMKGIRNSLSSNGKGSFIST